MPDTIEYTNEQKADIETRTEEFRKRHIANVEELSIDFFVYPQLVPSAVGYVTHPVMELVDKKYLPIPSPYQQ